MRVPWLLGLYSLMAEKVGEARELLSPKANPEEPKTSFPSSLEAKLRAELPPPNPRGPLLSPEGHHSQTSLEGIQIKVVSR